MTKPFTARDYYSAETRRLEDAKFAAMRPSLFLMVDVVDEPRRSVTPMEAAHDANVAIRERFDHDHFRRVLDARNYLLGE